MKEIKINGNFDINDPLYFNNIINGLSEFMDCLYDVTQLNKIDDKTYNITAKINIGPLSTTYEGTLTFIDRSPNTLVLKINGKMLLSSVNILVNMEIKQNIVTYEIQLNLAGLIEGMSGKTLENFVKTKINDFVSCISKSNIR
jgi:carbon monoxide dehydrogenase subunit G